MRFRKCFVLFCGVALLSGCRSSDVVAGHTRAPDYVVGRTHGQALEALVGYDVKCCNYTGSCDASNHHYHWQDARVLDQDWDGGWGVTLMYYNYK